MSALTEMSGFVMRNPVWMNRCIRECYEVGKVMDRYRRAHPVCELTGTAKDVHVHHILPLSIRPELAVHPGNLICLTRRVHFVLGHGCNWKNYVPNVRLLVREATLVRTIAHKESVDAP